MNAKSAQPRASQRLSSWQLLAKDCGRYVRTHSVASVTVVLVLAVSFIEAITSTLLGVPYPGAMAHVSFAKLSHGVPGSVLLSLFTLPHPLRLILDIPVVALCLGIAQHFLGVSRTLWVSAISTLGGIAGGMVLSNLAYVHTPYWQRIAEFGFVLGPLIIAVGPVMVGSAFSSLLWRRRIRVITYAFVITLVLYRGEPGDLAALTAVIIGHVLGYLMCAKSPRQNIVPGSFYELRRLIAVATGIMTLGPVVSLTSRISYGPLSTFGLLLSPVRFDYQALNHCLAGDSSLNCFIQYKLQRLSMPGGYVVSAMPIIVMLLICWGLFKGRRIAAILSLAANAITMYIAIVYYFVLPLASSYDGVVGLLLHGAIKSAIACIVLPLATIIAVLVGWRSFDRSTSHHRVVSFAVGTLVSFILLSFIYALGVLTHPESFSGHPTVANVLSDLPQRFLPIGFLNAVHPAFLPVDDFGGFLYEWIGSVFWVICAGLLFWCLQDKGQYDESRYHLANSLVEIDGESMSFMATWHGNRYWFSETGRSAIAYRLSHGIALTVTGPFGEQSEWDNDIIAFSQYCLQNSWTPVFYSIHEHQRELLESRGWSSLAVGTEMIVHPRTWETKGKKWQDVRTAINKAKREGMVDVLTTFADAPLAVQSQIIDISEEWTDEKALPEMRFTLGGVEELMDSRVRLLYAQDADGTIQGVTSWMPTYCDGIIVGWTLDFMRHRPDSANGVMEFLIARMAERLKEEDAEFMSLSAAPLAGISMEQEADEAPSEGVQMLTHVLQAVAELIEPAYGFHSLFRFKTKFQPQEEGVYLAYPDAAKLPQIALAVTHAYLPDMKPSDVVTFVKAITPDSENK